MITFADVFRNASCSSHPITIDFDPADVKTLVALGQCCCTEPNTDYDTCGSYCDTNSFAIGVLKDGRFVAAEESSDTSGHG